MSLQVLLSNFNIFFYTATTWQLCPIYIGRCSYERYLSPYIRDRAGTLTSISNATNVNVRAPTHIFNLKWEISLIRESSYKYIYLCYDKYSFFHLNQKFQTVIIQTVIRVTKTSLFESTLSNKKLVKQTLTMLAIIQPPKIQAFRVF